VPRQCYYLDPIKKAVSQPFSLRLDKKKVCQRLKKTNEEICEVSSPKTCAPPVLGCEGAEQGMLPLIVIAATARCHRSRTR